MKTKIATLLLCLLLLASIFGMVACEFSESTSTPTTSTEESGTEVNATIMAVYEQATALGYEGSLEEFLALVQGKDGEKGEQGEAGKDGVDGVGISKAEIIDGELVLTYTDGTSVNLGKVVGEDGKDGVDGAPGKDGADGEDGVDGAPGKDGEDGENGQDGVPGKDGEDGAPGKDGEDGEDGRGIERTEINANGELIIYYTDGTFVNLGKVVGEDGKDGVDGAPGKDGEDGKDGQDGANGTACEHTYGEWIEELAPTCESIGYNTRTCSTCGVVEYEFISEKGHELEILEVKVDTCEERKVMYYCTVCATVKYIEEAPTADHNFVDYVCTVCGEYDVTPDEYFMFFLRPDGTYAVTAKDKGDIPTVVVLPSTYNDKPVTEIDTYAFSGSQSLTKIIISNNINSIGSDAFYNCRKLTEVIIPNSVTSIGHFVFYDCGALSKVNYLGTIDEWAQIEFGTIESNPTYYAHNLYINNELVTNANLANVTKISPYAFVRCADITSLNIPNTVTEIGESAFGNCRGFSELTIPSSVIKIEESAFSYCGSLVKVNYTGTIDQWAQIKFGNIGSNPTSISKNLYINDVLVIEATLTTATLISDYAFYFCTDIASVTIGDYVTSIGRYAFGCCYGLKKIKLPKNLTELSDYMFSSCKSLTEIIIPDSVTSIGWEAFFNCSSLKTVYYYGTEEDWNKISIGSGNSNLTDATRYYYSESEPGLNAEGTAYDGDYWYYNENGEPTPWIKP